MPDSIQIYFEDDPYKPESPKDSLGQYVPYQNYDVYCEDIKNSVNNIQVDLKENRSFTAIQKFSPYGKILCDFRAIAILHP